MASRTDDQQAEKAYAEASAVGSAAAHAAAQRKGKTGKPVKAIDAAPLAIEVPLAIEPATDVALEPVAALLIEASPSVIAVAQVADEALTAGTSSTADTPPEPVAAPAATRIDTLVSKGQTMITEATTKMTEEATRVAGEAKARTEAMVGDMTVRAKAAAEKGQEVAKDAVEFSKGNVEAMVESMKILGRGMQDMGQELAGVAKQSMADTTEAAKRYAAVKSPTEFFQLQSELSKTALDTAVKNGAKATEMTVKLANDAFQPISNRIALAVSKLKNAA